MGLIFTGEIYISRAAYQVTMWVPFTQFNNIFRERNNNLITCVCIQIYLRHVGTEMLSQIVLVLVAIISSSQATVCDSFFNMVGEGQSHTGKVGEELKTRTKIECSVR